MTAIYEIVPCHLIYIYMYIREKSVIKKSLIVKELASERAGRQRSNESASEDFGRAKRKKERNFSAFSVSYSYFVAIKNARKRERALVYE